MGGMISQLQTPRYKTVIADLGLFYAAAIWGSTFFVVKEALNEIDPVIMVAYRFLLAGVLLAGYVVATKRPLFKDFGKGVLLAVIIWALYVPQTIGLGITTASNSAFITGLFVAFVPLFLKSIVKRKPTVAEVVASVVSLVGLWILTGGMKQVNAGDLLTLIAAVTYALHVLYSDKFMKTGVDPYVLACQQFLLVGVFSLVTGLIFGLPFSIGSTRTTMVVLFLGLFPTLSAFVIQLVAQKITAPVKVSLIFALEPVFGAIFAWTLGGEEFVLRGAIGGGFIFAALIISGLSSKLGRGKQTA